MKYKLRYLFYRKIPNFTFPDVKSDKYKSLDRCSRCKQGVNVRLGIAFFKEDGSVEYISKCPHCGADYVAEANTNLNHKLYIFSQFLIKLFWKFLDKLHLVRSSCDGRYDMFGDEWHYVTAWGISEDKTKYILKPRKWWEYIIIKKK